MAQDRTIVYDGFFDVPQEIEGTGMISTDPITRSKIIVRSYVVKTAFYQPLLYTNPALPVPDAVVKDVQFPTAILVEENAGQIVGPLFYFTRVFAEIPVDRTEPRLVAFAQPGQAAAQFSQYRGGGAISWNQYGGGQPYTRNVLSSVAYSYKTNPNNFVIPPITRITYQGPIGFSSPAPVDFVGDVYAYFGNRTFITAPITGFSVGDGTNVTEPNWVLQGSTNPRVLPASWLMEVSIERWRGTIWEMAVVTVPTNTT